MAQVGTATEAAARHSIVRFTREDSPLGPSEERWLREGLVAALPDLRMAQLFASRPDLLHEAEHLVVGVERDSGQPVSALGASWEHTTDGRPFLHIGVQFVAATLRGGQVFSTSWLALLEEVIATGGFPVLSALRTYNPVAYCAMRAYGELPGAVMYPRVTRNGSAPGGGSVAGPPDGRDLAMRALAGEIAATLAPGAAFDPASGLLAGIGVPRELYRERPLSADAAVNAHFARYTSPGDRILCAVHVHDPATAEAIGANFESRSARTSS